MADAIRITRRALARAAGAALGAVALPAAAITATATEMPPTAAAAGQGPDADLFALLAQLDEARRVQEAAAAAFDAAAAVHDPVWSDKPPALWKHPADHFYGFGRASGSAPASDGRSRRFYLASDVELIRALPPIMVRYRPDEDGPILSMPCERGEARRREIIAAHEAWSAAVERVEVATGYDAAAQRCDDATDALIDVEARVHDTPARTLAGLRAKAAVELVVAERAGFDQVVVDFLREVAAFAQAGA